MGKRLTHNIITGNDPHLGLCLYYSPHFDLNIVRRASSLTGERTKKDPAFKGFRQSINRMKQASPIAASLYKLVPEQVKQYALYRTLTGEVIKMLKEGNDAAAITESLTKKYITPLLDTPKKYSENSSDDQPVTNDRVNGMSDFTSYPPIPSGVRKMPRTRRSRLLQRIMEGQPAEHFSPAGSDTGQQTHRHDSVFPNIESDLSKRRTKTTSDLIYLGRLAECKKLKIWLRPIDPSGSRSAIR